MPIALSDKNGIKSLNVRDDGYYSQASSVSSIVDGLRPDKFYSYKKYIYAARGADGICSLKISSIALLKIDVEGAELEVLRGLKVSIEKYRPFIIFEVLNNYLVITNDNL